MKVKVVSIFRDKNTKETYKLNDEIEVSKERYNEIKEYVEIIKTKKGQE
jgi:hypothetical protein